MNDAINEAIVLAEICRMPWLAADLREHAAEHQHLTEFANERAEMAWTAEHATAPNIVHIRHCAGGFEVMR